MFRQLLFALLIFICASTNYIQGQYRLVSAFPNLDFLQPLDLQHPKDGTDRIFVVTQQGIIYTFPNDSTVTKARVFLDIHEKVSYGGEMGLLGLVFDPDFKNNGYFYIDYTTPNPLRSIIARYSVDKTNPDSADINSEQVILEVDQPFENHNAGQLTFGPDGYLYIGFGDGGSGGDPNNNAQNRSVLLGKMLRIDVRKAEGGRNYSIPADNPYAGNTQGFREEIYAYGFRNPWRFSFDPVTGWMWIADVGQDLWEEVDILQKGGNFGWRIMEATHCYNPSSNCDTTGLIMPVWEYGHNAEGGNSISGGYVYRGSRLPELYGKYIYSDFVSGRIWTLSYDGTKPAVNNVLISTGKNISSFGIDKNRELYVCSFDGKIYKLATAAPTLVPGNHPREYGLMDNFPNPFNPSTNITVDIKDKGSVKIQIYNVEGKVVDILFNGEMQPGRYQLLWDASMFPSGVYIYEVTAGNFKASKKMVLLK